MGAFEEGMAVRRGRIQESAAAKKHTSNNKYQQTIGVVYYTVCALHLGAAHPLHDEPLPLRVLLHRKRLARVLEIQEVDVAGRSLARPLDGRHVHSRCPRHRRHHAHVLQELEAEAAERQKPGTLSLLETTQGVPPGVAVAALRAILLVSPPPPQLPAALKRPLPDAPQLLPLLQETAVVAAVADDTTTSAAATAVITVVVAATDGVQNSGIGLGAVVVEVAAAQLITVAFLTGITVIVAVALSDRVDGRSRSRSRSRVTSVLSSHFSCEPTSNSNPDIALGALKKEGTVFRRL